MSVQQDFFTVIIRSLIIGLIYFEVTKDNDMTFANIMKFSLLYIFMVYSSFILGIDSNVVTNAFLTKTVFTFIDERVKEKQKITQTQQPALY